MFRRPSLLLRLTRALVGLVTVWCLGCFGYEPIVESLWQTGEFAEMDCVAMTATQTATHAVQTDVASAGTGWLAANVSVPHSENGFACGCGDCCHAVSPMNATTAVASFFIPFVAHLQPAELASITRSPLLPPPQREA